MILLYVVVLAAVYAATEVLPLGAAAHTYLLPALLGWPPLGAAAVSAAHMGMAAGIAVTFHRDVIAVGLGLWRAARGRPDAGSRLALNIAAGTLPALALGYVVPGLLGTAGTLSLTLWAMLGGGVLLWLADRLGMRLKRVEHLTPLGAAAIGAVQAAALVPGIGRTAITLIAARLMGYERDQALRFSMLLAVPMLLASSGISLSGLGLPTSPAMMAVAAACFVVTVAALAFTQNWVRRTDFALFAWYRILVGGALLAVYYYL